MEPLEDAAVEFTFNKIHSFDAGASCRGGRSGSMRVNNRLKDRKALRRQADTRADYNAGIVCGSQVAFHNLPSRPIATPNPQAQAFSLFHLWAFKATALVK
jgi:hypothetical protein